MLTMQSLIDQNIKYLQHITNQLHHDRIFFFFCNFKYGVCTGRIYNSPFRFANKLKRVRLLVFVPKNEPRSLKFKKSLCRNRHPPPHHHQKMMIKAKEARRLNLPNGNACAFSLRLRFKTTLSFLKEYILREITFFFVNFP